MQAVDLHRTGAGKAALPRPHANAHRTAAQGGPVLGGNAEQPAAGRVDGRPLDTSQHRIRNLVIADGDAHARLLAHARRAGNRHQRGFVQRLDMHIATAGPRAAIADTAVQDIAFDAVAHHIHRHRSAQARAIVRLAQGPGKPHDHLAGLGRHRHLAGIEQIRRLTDGRLDPCIADIHGHGGAYPRLAFGDRARAGHRRHHTAVLGRDLDITRLDRRHIPQTGDIAVVRDGQRDRPCHRDALLAARSRQTGRQRRGHPLAARRQRQITRHDQTARQRHFGARLSAQHIHAERACDAHIGLRRIGFRLRHRTGKR